jgi:DNA repair protein RecN (Recombination protein N)
MLRNLHIENYALIQSLELAPDIAMNIITGETGAGKSIMLGALGLLLGKRADTKVLLNNSSKCIIEGIFDIKPYHLQALFEEYEMDFEEECIIRREISPNGKSRAFVNDGLTNLEFLKALGLRLMDVHSQHETLLLSSSKFQLGIIDDYTQNNDTLIKYQTAFSDFQEKKRIHEELVHDSSELRKEADYNQFLFDELDKANFTEDEQTALEEEVKKLENAEEIKIKLNEALNYIDNAEISMNSVGYDLKNAINQIASYADNYGKLNQRIESILIELKDLTVEIESEESSVDFDPQRTEESQERLSLIYKLQQKHQVTSIQDLLSILEGLSDKVLKVENLDEAIIASEKVMDAAFESVQTLGKGLSKIRLSSFNKFETDLKYLLNDLGIPDSAIAIQHEIIKPTLSGIDDINILFSANKGVAPQSLKSAASGGEFSRLMFAIKYILADKTALPTIVFDEIDTGVSGEIAIQMAQMMEKMATNHQVIAITHLPQIAAKGKAHYFVYKDNLLETTSSKIKRLNESERINEIAQMIGGKTPSQKSLESAKELMSI